MFIQCGALKCRLNHQSIAVPDITIARDDAVAEQQFDPTEPGTFAVAMAVVEQHSLGVVGPDDNHIIAFAYR